MKSVSDSYIKSFCYWCNSETNHRILHQEQTKHIPDDEDDIASDTIYQIVKCYGCDAVSFRTDYTDEESWLEDDNGRAELYHQVNTYPHKKERFHYEPSFSIPGHIREIYREAIECYNNGLFIMAAAGCRATIEAICNEQEIEAFDLEKRIELMELRGIISKIDSKKLHAVRIVGNEALHKIKKCEEQELFIVFSIIKGILNSLYILEDVYQKLSMKPITYEEFKKILLSKIENETKGKIDTLHNIIGNHKFLIKSDRTIFEQILVQEIKDGKFPALSLVNHNDSTQSNQQFKIM